MEGDSKPKIGILVGSHGRGSNMRALARACAEGAIEAEVGLVVSPSESSPALGAARELGLRTAVVDVASPEAGSRLAEAFLRAGCTLVCLAGYMRLLPKEVLDTFPGRVLNIHPALLPKFGGKGMYGMRVHEAVLRSGETESGCTVHLVNERYDEGPIVVQLRCPVLPGDTPETLAARVLELEHRAYPEAVRKILAGRTP